MEQLCNWGIAGCKFIASGMFAILIAIMFHASLEMKREGDKWYESMIPLIIGLVLIVIGFVAIWVHP
jgi:hypothetical protein